MIYTHIHIRASFSCHPCFSSVFSSVVRLLLSIKLLIIKLLGTKREAAIMRTQNVSVCVTYVPGCTAKAGVCLPVGGVGEFQVEGIIKAWQEESSS